MSSDSGDTFTVWIESIPREWERLKEEVEYGTSMGEIVRRAIKMYVEILNVLEDYDAEYSDDELRDRVRMWVRQGIKEDME